MCNHYRDDEKIIEFVRNTMPWVRIPEILPQIRGHMYPKYPGPVVMQAEGTQSLVEMRWGCGLFTKTLWTSRRLSRARRWLADETYLEEPAKFRRCLVAMTGYYEPGHGPKGARGEALFTIDSQECLFVAGLWDTDPDKSGSCGFALVTTEPNDVVSFQF